MENGNPNLNIQKSTLVIKSKHTNSIHHHYNIKNLIHPNTNHYTLSIPIMFITCYATLFYTTSTRT